MIDWDIKIITIIEVVYLSRCMNELHFNVFLDENNNSENIAFII